MVKKGLTDVPKMGGGGRGGHDPPPPPSSTPELVQNTRKRTRSMSEIANSTLHKGCQRPIMMKRVHLRTYHSLYYRHDTLGTKTLLDRI